MGTEHSYVMRHLVDSAIIAWRDRGSHKSERLISKDRARAGAHSQPALESAATNSAFGRRLSSSEVGLAWFGVGGRDCLTFSIMAQIYGGRDFGLASFDIRKEITHQAAPSYKAALFLGTSLCGCWLSRKSNVFYQRSITANSHSTSIVREKSSSNCA